MMTRIDGLIILDPIGKPLITSHFSLHPPTYPSIHIDTFNHLRKQSIARSKVLDSVIGVNAIDNDGRELGTGLCWLEREGLKFLVPISEELNPLFAFSFLSSFLATLEDYLGDITENSIKENFEVVYMLIEEMLDEGHPMTTETAMLKDIVLPPTLVRKILNVAGVSGIQSPTSPFTAPIPWRRQNIRHANNEIYFDIEESMEAIVDRRGSVLSSSVWGRVNAKSRLSGNPDLLLTFSNPKLISNCSFHPCIRYSKWEKNGVLSFIPPDGRFKLLEFQVPPMRVQLPLQLVPKMSIEENGGGQFSLTLTSRTNHRPIQDIVVSIFLGYGTNGVSATATGDKRAGGGDAHGPGAPVLGTKSEVGDGYVGGGTWEFDPHTQVMKWTISSLVSTERPPTLTGSFTSSETHSTPSPAFDIAFTIPNHSYSGLKVDQLKVSGDVNYKPFKGIRQIARAGKMEVRW
ncbi:putative adaptor complex subunit medium chain 3 [Kockovaella imperatae]|uniref:Putative adaptor complex subunit medium chain 3 n=1 Tax=Kockovaella imperatae TaxID=4999 RepID=A0A1Y1UPM7_9TREE|nr:putative adaptor complex subunit medium chain 3 [Kockovaella imperatae]ORX40010.1 putative adaptor complex subunit medium chain 3 [Kockovaella imperatae]